MYVRKITERDYIKANRRASREAEIENHSHPLSLSRVHKSKKVYDRKRQRADDKRHLPSFFYLIRLYKQIETPTIHIQNKSWISDLYQFELCYHRNGYSRNRISNIRKIRTTPSAPRDAIRPSGR